MSADNYERLFSSSPRDANLYRISEQLMMVFGVISLLLLFLDAVMWFQGSLKVPVSHLIALELPFPVAFFLSTWFHRRIARKYGLL